MAILKCKMCGGDINVDETMHIGKCECCGSTMTLPKDTDDQKANLFNRANHFRRNNDFDKALNAYEAILDADNNDAEAHWGVVLCKYGIEYVEDPQTKKMVATCHRTQFTSVLTDIDYIQAMENADYSAQKVYENEAKEIDKIQKGILEISSQESPFDIFICYKESDGAGKRTQDSVLAQDIYYQLVEQGFKVFFSKITLEDKLGTEYEPYIFAALNSAKVMIVVGTQPEYFNAVWVKNEWSRYLSLIKSGAKKLLIPAYKGMDPYDLPEAFSNLQAQDMSKLGFVQDLIRGIRKLTDSGETVVSETIIQNGSVSAAPLLERAFICIEDAEFAKADELLEQVLNLEPKNARAYVGKLLCKLELTDEAKLSDGATSLTEYGDFNKAVRYADSRYKMQLLSYDQSVANRKEENRKADLYDRAMERFKREEYSPATAMFHEISSYKDSAQMIEKIKELKKIMEHEQELIKQRAEHEQELVRQQKIERAAAEEKEKLYIEAERKKRIKRLKIAIPIVLIAIGAIFVVQTIIIPMIQYNKGLVYLNNQQYEEASAAFEKASGYKDADVKMQELYYNEGMDFFNQEKYTNAIPCFQKASGYQDALTKAATSISAAERNKKIAAGAGFTLCLKPDGTVVTTGSNDLGQCNVSDWTDILSISCWFGHTVGLRADGTVVATGSNDAGQCDVSDWTGIISVVANDSYSVGLKSDGTVVATGSNDAGQCNVSDWTEIVSISCGFSHTVGLKSDGTVVATGDNGYGQCNVSNWADIISISCWFGHTVGLKADGTVVATGFNNAGQCDVSDWTDIISVVAGSNHTVGLKSDGTVVATGVNVQGQCNVSDWTDIISVVTGSNHTVGLKLDGTVVATGVNVQGQCDVKDWGNITEIVAARDSTVGLKSDGTLVATK